MGSRVRTLWALTALLTLALFLGACAGDNENTNTLGSDPYVTEGGTARVFASFDAGTMPLPNDLPWELQRQATDDPAAPAPVRLPIEPDDGPELQALKAAVNALGIPGLSPNMFLSMPLTGAVDESTLQLIAFRLDGQELPRVATPLASNFELLESPIVDANPFTPAEVLKLLPDEPFTPGAFYAVAAKVGLKDTNGFDVSPSFTTQALKSPEPFSADSPFASFEPLRQAYNAPGGLYDGVAQVTAVVFGTPWTREDILVLWTFHTADVTLSLPNPETGEIGALPYATLDREAKTFKDLSAAVSNDQLEWLQLDGTYGPTPQAFSPDAVWAAATDPELTSDPTEDTAETGRVYIPNQDIGSFYFGRFSSVDLNPLDPYPMTVTFFLTLPAPPGLEDRPVPVAGPYPTVVYQHGLALRKETGFALANTFAKTGLALLAIDAPFHGDRTPEGTSTGELFFTANLILDRLNVYQGAVDLWETYDLLEDPGIDLTGDEAPDLVSAGYAVHSLGSIIGSVFLSQDDRPARSLLSSPTAELSNVLDETDIEALQEIVGSLGYLRGTTDYYVFLDLLQWLLDPIDGAYTGIGDRDLSTDPTQLLTDFAYLDPTVSNASTRVFLRGVGAPEQILVPLEDVNVLDPLQGAFPGLQDLQGGTYLYGGVDEGGELVPVPVVHSFLLSPEIRTTALEYDEAIQYNATVGAQVQAALYFALPFAP